MDNFFNNGPNILKLIVRVRIYHIVKRIIGILCVQWFEVRGEHPKNRNKYRYHIIKRIIGLLCIQWFTKLPNFEQSYKGKVKTHKCINRQNQSTTGKLWKP
jgi:hypothetical protein